jgi:hypothetical protein
MADDDRPARQQINVRVLERFVSSVTLDDDDDDVSRTPCRHPLLSCDTVTRGPVAAPAASMHTRSEGIIGSPAAAASLHMTLVTV